MRNVRCCLFLFTHIYLPDLVIFELKHDSLTEVKGNHIHIQNTAGMLCEGKTHAAMYLACKVALSLNNMTSTASDKEWLQKLF